MKIHGVKWEWSSPFFTRLKKHYCPNCGDLLKTIKMFKVVNSKSQEAKDYDFSLGDTYIIGNIKFIWIEFKCSKCDKTYHINEIRKSEKLFKKRK